MGVPICSGGEIFRLERNNFAWFSTKIGNIDNNETFCDFRIKERKNEMRASKACINYRYLVGKL